MGSSCSFTISRIAVRGNPSRPVACAIWLLVVLELLRKERVIDPDVIWNDLVRAVRRRIKNGLSAGRPMLLWLNGGGTPPQLTEPDDLDEAARSSITWEFCLGVFFVYAQGSAP